MVLPSSNTGDLHVSGSTEDVRDRIALSIAVGQVIHQEFEGAHIFRDDIVSRIVGFGPEILGFFYSDGRYREGHFYVAARTRYIDETIARAAAGGTAQFVVLDAGLNTFGLRNLDSELRVFEVDRREAQTWKRHRMADASIPVPPSLTFVPVEDDLIREPLLDAGFDPSEPSLFIWTSTVPVTTMSRVVATIAQLAEFPHVALVFEYVEPLDQPESDIVAALDFPLLSAFSTADAGSLMESFSFQTHAQITGSELLSRYTDEFRGHPGLLRFQLITVSSA